MLEVSGVRRLSPDAISDVRIGGRSACSRPLHARPLPILCCVCLLGAAVHPRPSASTQLLVARSLDRAIAQLDVSRLVGRKVEVELIGQGGNRDFAKAFVEKRLRERGVLISADTPEEKLQVFATVLGGDRGETLLGIPATYVPVFDVGTPEVSIFKWVRNRGLVELELDALEPKGSKLVEWHGPVVGSAKRDDFTLLIFLTFTLTDAVPGQ